LSDLVRPPKLLKGDEKILVAGCGAIGSVFACLLGEAGHRLTLLGRGAHLRAIAAKGLDLDGIWGRHHAEAKRFKCAESVDELEKPYDLILIAVKAYDTRSMVGAVAPLIADQGLAISLQNGLGNIESLAEAFGPERSLGANILVGATVAEPGRVTVTVQAAPIVLGPIEGSDCVLLETVHEWANLFKAAGIPCEATTRILSHVWAKVFYNAPLNALGALLDVHYGVLADEPELKRTMDRIIDEAFNVAAAKHIELLWRDAAVYRELFYRHLVPSTYNHRSSMLQDLQRQRRTEIDAINGRIWEYGAGSNVPTPYNETMTRLIWHREGRADGPGSPANPPRHAVSL
jgi:2-dehydropantoate 2-reductase